MAYFDTLFQELVDVVRAVGSEVQSKLDTLISTMDNMNTSVQSMQQAQATTAQAAQGGGGGGAGGGAPRPRGGGDDPGKGGLFNDLVARTKTQLKRGTAIGVSNAVLEGLTGVGKSAGAGLANLTTAGSTGGSAFGAGLQALQGTGFTVGGDTGGILDRAAGVTGGITEQLARAGIKVSDAGRQKLLNQQILAERRVQIEREQVANAANRARVDVNLAESARGSANLTGRPDTSQGDLVKALEELTRALERNKPKSGF